MTILDDRGIALNDRDDGETGSDAADVQRSLQTALDEAFGAGSTIVRVRAEFDRSESSQREIVRTSLGNAAISQDSVSETYAGDGKRYEKRGDRADRGSDLRETASSLPSGGIARVSTAVFVDAARAVDLGKVRDLASAAVGYDARRGDELSVQSVRFERPAAPAHRSRWWLVYGALVSVVPALVLAVAIVAAARYAVRPLSRALRRFSERAAIAERSSALTGIAPARVHGALAGEPAARGGRDHQRASGRDGRRRLGALPQTRTRGDRTPHAAASRAARSNRERRLRSTCRIVTRISCRSRGS